MIYLLDTNACIRYLRSPVASVAQKVAVTSPDAMAISAMTVVELVRGAYRSARMQENLNQVQAMVAQFMCLPLDQMVAVHAGQIDAELMASRSPASATASAPSTCTAGCSSSTWPMRSGAFWYTLMRSWL